MMEYDEEASYATSDEENLVSQNETGTRQRNDIKNCFPFPLGSAINHDIHSRLIKQDVGGH